MARRDAPGPYSLETLAATPVPSLFTRDPEVLKARYVAWFERETGRTLYPAQVEMMLIHVLAYAMSLLGEEGQIAAEEHLVAKASIAGLIALGPNRSMDADLENRPGKRRPINRLSVRSGTGVSGHIPPPFPGRFHPAGTEPPS